MKILSLPISAIGILACFASAPADAQVRAAEPALHLHAVNPSMSLGTPANNPLQEQTRQDYATGLMNDQRQLLQQNPSGATRQERAIEQQLNGYTPR
ncbi:MAG TPA: hypothetical protein VGI28_12945 [Stellaceae bacterium]|jgi:hypothetical protein